jgi:molybdate transport system ATP-binding protein
LKTIISSEKITALYGKSGVGKSSILRMIAGLESPDGGEIMNDDLLWFSKSKKINIPVSKRNLGFVFQDYNLFPAMSVQKNLEYASENGSIPLQVISVMKIIGAESLLSAFPSELSGGQKQRVAILRALCQQPELLLLDEPFSALDDDTISDLIKELETIRKSHSVTIIVVSHRKDIIFAMADEVIELLEDGSFKQGKPEAVLSKSI